ncbi:MAG TPA: polysaccharide biosynthesis C-terminal domain-containing protein [Cyclobacteriaceae bacterium]|nr:polysaccharide biosynthesis C-terminal domain-containing protein [Cyclobacteriaceae bacterium]
MHSSKIKNLAGETVLYGLGNMVPRLLNFFLFPIHTRFFRPEEYGVFTYLMSVVALLNIVYTFGMETSYFRFATKPGADEKKVFNVAQTVVTSISAIFSLSFIFFASSFAGLLNASHHENYIIWLSLIMFIDNVVSIPFARLRLQKKPLQFAFFRISNVIILTGLNLYFLNVIFDPQIGISYIFIANLIANAFYLIFFFKTLTSWRPSFDREIFSSMIQYAYPVMLTGLAGMTNEFFSRLALENWLPKNFYPGKSSAYALGVFGACYKFSVLMNLAVQAFRMAGEPFFFSQASDRSSPQLFAKVNHYFVIVCCVILLGVSINLDVLKFLVQSDYWEGLNIIPPLLLGYLFLGVYYNYTVWFKLTDKTHYGTIITIGGAILTIAFNFVLIPIAGYYGSSWATVLVYFSMMGTCYLLGQKYYPIPYRILSDSMYIIGTSLLIYLVNEITIESLYISVSLHAAVIIAFIALVYGIEKKDFRTA